ncbi:hypothetical protein C8R47DRAFT_1099622 [Mycena vitilis]|nr:hypothetical protein C8R47DRAFT_1099622 [Mycena vitilis]
MEPHARNCSFESSVEHLLHTNVVPTPQECAQITGHILVQPRKDLALLDAEIQRMQRSLDGLKARREILATDIDAHLALLSPIHRLPDDVLCEIFVSSLPHTHNAIISSREAPLLLCHVSSGWRNVALNTPRLWSSLHVVIPDHRFFQNITYMVEMWLSRSGILPLSISVGVSLSLTDSDAASASSLLDVLLAVSHRWEAVEFTAPPEHENDWFSQPLSALSPVDVPGLRHIKFGFEDTTALSSPFLAARSISSLSLPYIPPEVNTISTISWPRITRLELGSSNYECAWGGNEILNILRRTTNLENCTLLIPHAEPHLIEDEIADLPHLTSLSVTCREHTVSVLVLQRVRAPGLRSFECIQPSHIPICIFRTLTACTPKLQNLAITGVFPNTMFLHEINLFKVLPPSIETLKISSQEGAWQGDGGLSVSDELLHAFTSTFFPVLTTITIEGCSEATDAGVLAYVKARAVSGAPLQRLDIGFTRPMAENILPDLDAFISEGLTVSLRYETERSERYRYRPWEFTDVVD